MGSKCSSQQSSCSADRQRRTKTRRQERACRLTAVLRGLSSECASFCYQQFSRLLLHRSLAQERVLVKRKELPYAPGWYLLEHEDPCKRS